MSAETLRAAAEKLEALAADCERNSPTPWEHGLSGEWRVWDCDRIEVAETHIEEDAAYLAAVGPNVARALTAWLRTQADLGHGSRSPAHRAAVAVARQILGGAR